MDRTLGKSMSLAGVTGAATACSRLVVRTAPEAPTDICAENVAGEILADVKRRMGPA